MKLRAPWFLHLSDEEFFINDVGGCEIVKALHHGSDHIKARAKLMALAPEMLLTLKMVERALEEDRPIWAASLVQDVLAKIEE